MGEQGHDDHHGLCRGAQPIEDGTFAGAEGFVTRVTDEPLFLLRMDTDIALARLASGRTVPIGAECGCGVHDGPPGVVWKHAKRSIFGPPFSLQVRFTTVQCRATNQLVNKANYDFFTQFFAYQTAIKTRSNIENFLFEIGIFDRPNRQIHLELDDGWLADAMRVAAQHERSAAHYRAMINDPIRFLVERGWHGLTDATVEELLGLTDSIVSDTEPLEDKAISLPATSESRIWN